MGPVISAESKSRVVALIQGGVHEGGNVLLDGRSVVIPGFENGNIIAPTVLENIPLDGQLIDTEIFGPVMSLIHLNTIDDAIAFINKNRYGNMACVFTRSEEHTSELQSRENLVCRLLLEKKKHK